jgi:hypothetical protein
MVEFGLERLLNFVQVSCSLGEHLLRVTLNKSHLHFAALPPFAPRARQPSYTCAAYWR